jgi:hypothetical protein
MVVHRHQRTVILITLFVLGAAATFAVAQSGRKEAQTPSPQIPDNEKNRKGRELPTAFIVVTAEPDYAAIAQEYVRYSSEGLEYHARGGCVVELKKIPGARVVEDEDVPRPEARDTAFTEVDAWVIWMELQWDKGTRAGSLPFKVRYLLFEPATGRMVASGYGNPVRQTWGRPKTRFSSPEELAREAGRDIADKVMWELERIR